MSDYLAKGEHIRTIAEYPNYAVSNLGNVYHVYADGRLKRMKLGTGKNGYRIVRLGNQVTLAVHRAVAKAFLPAPMFPNMTVNHKNGIKTDNRACNLEWLTQQENCLHGRYVLGRQIHPVMAVDAGGRIVSVAASIKQLEAAGFNNSHVSECMSGKLKTHHGCTFRRLSIQEYNSYVGQHFCLGHKIRYAHGER
jgi:hypothetical protein